MPFYALVEADTGDILDVVTYLEGPAPVGVLVIELPARWEDVEAYLRARRKDRGGGGGGEVLLERDEQGQGGKGGARRDLTDAEEFYARLEAQLARAEAERRNFTVMLFDLAPSDRAEGHVFVQQTLREHDQELLPCDTMTKLRDHLVAVLMPDIDARDQAMKPRRGESLTLVYPYDAMQLRTLARRQHSWLKPRAFRGEKRSA